VQATNEFRATVTGFSEFTLGSDNNLLTSVDEPGTVPMVTELSANWPNPFNPRTTVRYALAQGSHVKLSVYDAIGRVVTILFEGKRDPGVYEVAFDASGLSSGVYFCRLQAGDIARTRKLVLLR
jgi:hypothetical protein